MRKKVTVLVKLHHLAPITCRNCVQTRLKTKTNCTCNKALFTNYGCNAAFKITK